MIMHLSKIWYLGGGGGICYNQYWPLFSSEVHLLPQIYIYKLMNNQIFSNLNIITDKNLLITLVYLFDINVQQFQCKV